MKKAVIGVTAAVLAVYLGYVLVAQVFPYIQWIANAKHIVTLTFDTTEEFYAEASIDAAVREWLELPDELPEGVALTSVAYEHDGFTTPNITVVYERGGKPYMEYKIGGNHDLPLYKKLRSVPLNQTEGDLMVGRDNSVLVKWPDPSGQPYRYLYFYDSSFTETEMVEWATTISAMHATI